MGTKLKLPLTIEGQLECYYLSENHTERHEILWHAWNQNKRWINQLLQMTLASFPTYSKHDESHASSVLHNIEMILGEERIAQLSASDCFVLLHTVYIHDIGMCITYKDREEIVTDRKFLDMVDELEAEGDHSLSIAIEALKQTDYSYTNEEEEVIKTQKLYEDKLQVYYALIHLIANYRRGEHGIRSKERLYDWTLNPDKLGIGFSLSGIPLRIFLSIANSAQLHTNPKFEEIMSLPQEDDGFALDYYHPRFISVLLQLGDILDMDNNRFHPLTKECMGSLPELSEQHYDKHLAIRRLHIRPDRISIEADCKTQESLRLVRKECDMLISMLQAAGYYWSVICPPDFIGALPTVEEVKLSLQGQMIPEELVTTQFKISQKKAFSLLEGANVYSGQFVFLREFLQNAVDATKMQYWNECCSTKGYYDSPKVWKNASPDELNKKVSIENFPIEIEMEIQKKDRAGNLSGITKEDIDALDANKNVYVYGVKVRIKDFGTGIDKDRVLSISEVGSSRKDEKLVIENMPEWLRPTAEFGVGLQSAFLLTGSFKCYTYTRTGQRYEITFGSVSTSRHEGYINVKPVKIFEEKDDTYGTCFEVFVPCDKKFLHQDYYDAWNGEDAFDEYYECRRPLRHSAELLTQMALYLDKQIGELLFPVRLHVKQSRYTKCSLNETEKSKISHIDLHFDSESANEKNVEEKDVVDEEDVRPYENNVFLNEVRKWSKGKPSWIYSINEYDNQVTNSFRISCGTIGQLKYLFDYDSGELHIWDGNKSVFATVSAKNLIVLEEVMTGAASRQFPVPNGTRVYYKGISLQRRCIEEDSEIIEYIDIKGGLKREHINLNRNGFTVEGERYFKNEIYRPILHSTNKILKHLAQLDEENGLLSWVSKNIDNKCEAIERLEDDIQKLQSEVDENELRNTQEAQYIQMEKKKSQEKSYIEQMEVQIVSVIVMAYLAMREEYDQIGCTSACMEGNPWCKLVNDIRVVLEKHYKVLELLRQESNFFNLISYDESCNYQLGRLDNSRDTRQRITFVDIFSPDYSYAIVQVRDNNLRPWKQYLIQLPTGENVLKAILELRFIRDEEQKKHSEREIEGWGRKILRNARNFREAFFVTDDSKQQFIIKWLLKSVPTIGMFADEDGNIRVNVLSNKTTPYLYVNENFKILIVQRILEKWRKDGIKRFSTFSWHSNLFLGCRNIPYKIYYVKRGYMSDFTLNRTILPLGEHELSEISEALHKDNHKVAISKLLRLYETVSIGHYIRKIYASYYENEERKKLSNEERTTCEIIEIANSDHIFRRIRESYSALVIEIISEKCAGWKYEDWKKMASEIRITLSIQETKEWHKLFRNIAQIECKYWLAESDEVNAYKKELRAVTREESFWSLCEVWLYLSYYVFNVENQELHIQKIRDKYFKELKTNKMTREKQKRIYDYVLKNGYFKMSEENIENCYLQYAEEIFNLFKEVEIRNSRAMLNNIPEKGKKEILGRIALMFGDKHTREEALNGEK